MSRSLGDHEGEPYGVIMEPTMDAIDLSTLDKNQEYVVVVALDGLLDKVPPVGGPKNGSSKSACRAARLSTRVNRTCVHRSEQQAGLESRKPAIKLHRSAQQNKTQECNGAHYVLCRSQE
jgi:hypothetical protein